jgi:holo-[acyl-carrier protein] synthase
VIVGVGIDLIRCSGVEGELNKGSWSPEDGTFTANELRSCAIAPNRGSRLSACFAAKEAALKALGVEVEDLGMFREVEVLYGPSGRPSIVLHDRAQSKAQRLGVRHVWISTASAKKHAGAMVVLES